MLKVILKEEKMEELPERQVKLPPADMRWSLSKFLIANADLNSKNSDEAKWLHRASLANGYPNARLANAFTILTRLRQKQERELLRVQPEQELDEFIRLVRLLANKSENMVALLRKERAAYQKQINQLQDILKGVTKFAEIFSNEKPPSEPPDQQTG